MVEFSLGKEGNGGEMEGRGREMREVGEQRGEGVRVGARIRSRKGSGPEEGK